MFKPKTEGGGGASDFALACAIYYAIGESVCVPGYSQGSNVKVIMSLGAYSPAVAFEYTRIAIVAARAAGVAVVTAAGNESTDRCPTLRHSTELSMWLLLPWSRYERAILITAAE